MTRDGEARSGKASCGRRGTTWRGGVRPDKARQARRGKVGYVLALQGTAGEAGFSLARRGLVRRGEAGNANKRGYR